MRGRDFRENNMAESMENEDEFDMDQDSDSGTMEVESDIAAGADEIERLLMETDISDIPKILIVTNVDVSVFENDNSKVRCGTGCFDDVMHDMFQLKLLGSNLLYHTLSHVRFKSGSWWNLNGANIKCENFLNVEK